jgi:elongation factor Ts
MTPFYQPIVRLADGKLTGFDRFQLGEGIQKESSDFAAEVAAAAGKG